MTIWIFVKKKETLKKVSCGYFMIGCDLDFRLKLSDIEGLKLLSEG